MSKGLEALEKLMADYYEMCQDLGNNDDQYQRCNLTSERAIIEKELKRLEDFDSVLNTGGGIWAENGIVSKKLKALEIMKNKEVDVHKFLDVQCIEHYNLGMIGAWKLTAEEYGLLKEVLCEKQLDKVMANQRNTGKSTYELEKIKRTIEKKS